MLVPPLPVVGLFPFARLGPIVILLVMLFQILVPMVILAVIPLVLNLIVVVLCAQNLHGRQ